MSIENNIITRDKIYKAFFILPAIALAFTFYLLPNILNFFYAFTDWNSYSSDINFIGLYNFKGLIADKYMFKSILITVKYAVGATIIQNVVALILAFALEKTSKINGIFRTIFFIPVLFSPLAAGYIFKGIYNPNGPINDFLSIIMGREIGFGYLSSLKYTLLFVILVHAWKYMGLFIIVYIAGLNAIPEELVEAAKIEGASFMDIIKKIKIPLMGPAFTFNIAISLIGGLSNLGIVFSLTRGGPARASEVLNMLILMEFATGSLGRTVTISTFLFILVCIFALPVIVYLRKREVEL